MTKCEKLQYVVITGYDEFECVFCLGVFDTLNEAYGKAYLYLDDKIKGMCKEGKWSISHRSQIDVLGYRIWLNKPENEEDDSTYEWVYIMVSYKDDIL